MSGKRNSPCHQALPPAPTFSRSEDFCSPSSEAGGLPGGGGVCLGEAGPRGCQTFKRDSVGPHPLERSLVPVSPDLSPSTLGTFCQMMDEEEFHDRLNLAKAQRSAALLSWTNVLKALRGSESIHQLNSWFMVFPIHPTAEQCLHGLPTYQKREEPVWRSS